MHYNFPGVIGVFKPLKLHIFYLNIKNIVKQFLKDHGIAYKI